MADLEQNILFSEIIWYSSLFSPILFGVATVYLLSRKRHSRFLYELSMASILTITIVGVIGSIAVGQLMLDGLRLGPPLYLVEENWFRMWYPLVICSLTSIFVAFFAFYQSKKFNNPNPQMV